MERPTKASTLETLAVRSASALFEKRKEKGTQGLAINVPRFKLDISFLVNIVVRVICSFLSKCRTQFSVFDFRFVSETNQPYLPSILSTIAPAFVNC